MRILLLAFALAFVVPASAFAELSVPHFFSNHMVLQREGSAAIWGKADPGAVVTVRFKKSSGRSQGGRFGSLENYDRDWPGRRARCRANGLLR